MLSLNKTPRTPLSLPKLRHTSSLLKSARTQNKTLEPEKTTKANQSINLSFIQTTKISNQVVPVKLQNTNSSVTLLLNLPYLPTYFHGYKDSYNEIKYVIGRTWCLLKVTRQRGHILEIKVTLRNPIGVMFDQEVDTLHLARGNTSVRH